MNPPPSPPKLRVLLIPNNTQWILGLMSEQIRLALSAEFDFVILPETLFEARPQLWDRILSHIDIVHCMNESSAGVLRARGAPRVGGVPRPVLTWIHHVTHWSPDHEAAAQISDALIVCTDDWKHRIAEFTAKPIHVVRHGVDSARFTHIPNARHALGIPESDFVVGFFGSQGSDSDNNRKGMDTFLEVARCCAREIPNFRILLLGPGWDARVFADAGIAITYPGFLAASQLPAAYSALDTYLMTARVEGGPCTVLESMACGTPVVATRVGLVPDVVVDGENGFTAAPGDVETLAAAVCALAASPDLRARQSRAARATAVTLPWPTMLAPLAEIYRSVLPSTSATTRAPISSPTLNRTAIAAEAILKFRYTFASDWKKKKFTRSIGALRNALEASGNLTTLLRGLRLAARGQI